MTAYGVDNFSFEIIEECADNQLNERESYWIQQYNCIAPNGYNMTSGGEGTVGYSRPQSTEERLKRQASSIQFFIDHPEARQAASRRTKKLWQDEEYRKKVTESNHKFYQEHPDMFKGENNPMYGKKHTEEALAKMRAHAATRKNKIAQLDKDTLEIIKIFDGIKDAEKAMNISHGWLSRAARQGKIAYGYRWKLL